MFSHGRMTRPYNEYHTPCCPKAPSQCRGEGTKGKRPLLYLSGFTRKMLMELPTASRQTPASAMTAAHIPCGMAAGPPASPPHPRPGEPYQAPTPPIARPTSAPAHESPPTVKALMNRDAPSTAGTGLMAFPEQQQLPEQRLPAQQEVPFETCSSECSHFMTCSACTPAESARQTPC